MPSSVEITALCLSILDNGCIIMIIAIHRFITSCVSRGNGKEYIHNVAMQPDTEIMFLFSPMISFAAAEKHA